MDYFLHVLVVCFIYSTLAISADLLVGRLACVPLCQAAFFGLGAYTSSLLALHVSFSFAIGAAVAVAIAFAISFLVSLPSLRLHEDHFVIATFGFQMILFSVFNNWVKLTRGPMGLPGIPQPVIFGWRVETHLEYLALAAVIAGFAFFVVQRITSSPFGRVLHAIREDEIFAKTLRKNTLYFKVTAFAVSAALAAMAGSLYAHYITYIDPTSFTVMDSVLIVSMVIIGGAGTLWGPVLGAIVLVTLPEALRFIGLPSAIAANLRQIIYGSLLVMMMLFRPKGLVGLYGFDQ